jgi:hypothetical protein
MANKERREELALRFDRLPKFPWAERIRAGNCPLCGNPIDETEFRDELSRKEFELSHMCQKCQDDAFAEPKEE